jgi:protein required for attachment to host cells
MWTCWMLIADAGRAKILAKGPDDATAVVVRQVENPAGQARNQQIVSDRPGRFNKRGRSVTSTMVPRADPHEQEAQQFAKQLGDLLEGEAGKYDRLLLIAPAHFLGLLREEIGPAARHRLLACLAKDLTNLPERELVAQWGDLSFGSALSDSTLQ